MHTQTERARLPKVKPFQAREKPGGRFRGEVEFSDGLTIERVMLTPDMAREFLGTLYEKQRPIRNLHLAGIARDVRDGRWRFNAEPLMIDDLGHLINGQHRCTVCAQTGIPMDVVIIRGVPSQSYESIDNVGKRSGADAIRDKSSNATTVASALGLLYRWDQGLPVTEKMATSPTLVAELLERHPGMIQSGRVGQTSRYVTKSPAAAAFCHYIFSRIDPEQADLFMETVTGGENIAKGNPIYAFRQRLINEVKELRPYEVVHYLVLTWNAWRQNKKVLILKTPSSGSKIPEPI